MPTFNRVGFWAALVCGLGAVGYGVASVLVGILAPAALTWEGYEQFVTGYSIWPTMAVLLPPFAVTIVFPVLALAIHAMVAVERRPFALLALLFSGIYSAVLGSAYWMQLTTVPWNVIRGATDGIEPWVVWNPASFFWSLETFGYFAMGLACVFVGLALGDTVPRRLRRGLIAMGPLGVYFLGTSFKDALLDTPDGAAWATAWALSAVFAWVILFGFVSLSLAGWFRRAAIEVSTRPEPRPQEALRTGGPPVRIEESEVRPR